MEKSNQKTFGWVGADQAYPRVTCQKSKRDWAGVAYAGLYIWGNGAYHSGALGIDEQTGGLGMSEQGNGDADKAAALMGGIRARYGERLTEEQLNGVSEDVKKIAAATGLLRAVALDNGDIPFVATPYSGD